MRLSKYHLPTLKEAPSSAEIISHKLMIRAGLIKKLTSGVYTLLPMGLRVIRKVEKIVREEMDKSGALEVCMPSVQPSELWVESGRWGKYGKELLRIKDRHGREFCYGPTHEEVVTDLVRDSIRSYRDLPINIYQIQTKFRDEIRPRYGMMRAREFMMKDAYSFDTDEESARKSYQKMRSAYMAIFKTIGLDFRAVEADTGQIGGSSSHEFMVLADSGEDTIAYCDKCDYSANIEKVELARPEKKKRDPAEKSCMIEKVSTPGLKSIEDVARFFDVDERACIKALVYITDDEKKIVALVRGDHEVNEIKLARLVGAEELRFATDEEIEEAGSVAGYVGPVGLEGALVVADHGVITMNCAVAGANETGFHFTNVEPSVDFTADITGGIRKVLEGDKCPRCDEGKFGLAKGIEVGHIFALGTKYSESMKATYLSADGKENPMVMGCYGIGIGRTAAAAIEQMADENGIVWPTSIAPYQVCIMPLDMKSEALLSACDKLEEELAARGIDVAVDDRNARPGVKFNDADLVGYPIQVVVGKKSFAEGNMEIKIRKSGEKFAEPIGDGVEKIIGLLKDL